MASPTVQELHDELERVKRLVGAHIGVDMRSPAQVEQANQDAADAEKRAAQQAQTEV